MFKIIGFAKKSWRSLLVIIVLLVIQAYCELSLPGYTSDIVDIGIQQGGIEENVPTIIRESQLDKVKLFLNEEESAAVMKNYTERSEESLSKEDYQKYVNKYPQIEQEPIYELNSGISQEELDRLELIMLPGEMMTMLLSSDSEEAVKMQASFYEQLGVPADSGVDLFEIIAQMPKEAVAEMMTAMNEEMAGMAETMASQMATAFVKSEYSAVGVDLDSKQINYIMIAGLKMLAFSLIAVAATVFVSLLSAKVGATTGRDLRTGVFGKVVSFSNNEMDKFSTASLITRSTNDIQQVQMVVTMMLRMVVYAPIMGIGGVIKVTSTNTSMAWIIAIAVGAVLCLVLILMAVAMPKFKKMQDLVDRLNLVAREILTGIPVIRAFSREKHEEKRFDNANDKLMQTQLFTSRAMAFMMPCMMFIMNGITVLILWVGAKGINVGTIQVGDMMAFITYTMQIVMSFLMITMVSIMLPRASVAAGRIDAVLKTESGIKDSEHPKSASGKGELVFDHVHFRYASAEEDALTDLTFTAKPGETTAIIGSTGSGKSTLVNLIPRLYDVTQGSIKIDGTDVREIPLKTLRHEIGFVPQKAILFSGTIGSNLRFEAEQAQENEIEAAADIAQAMEFIASKPERFETPIAQGGSNVSGGQKQRLAIARAVAKHPKIYVFDDSFSALDYKTDIALRRALKEKTAESTVIIVAQRISTILNAEKILVLDEGQIVGMGSHKELLATNEVYQQIAASQLSAEELAGSGQSAASDGKEAK